MNVAAVDVRMWNDDQRRLSSYIVLGVAAAVALAGVALWFFLAATPAWLYWVFVVLLVLVLAFMAALLFLPPMGAAAATAAPEAVAEGEAAPEAYAPDAEAAQPAAFEPRILSLRCGDCGTIFEVTDTGERPLYHTCPGCGAEGALRDEPVAAEAAPEMAEPEMAEPEMAPPESPEEGAAAEAAASFGHGFSPPLPAGNDAEAVAEPAPVKKLKLRCGGCKEVFTIEDTGERPLKRACPHCARIGKIA